MTIVLDKTLQGIRGLRLDNRKALLSASETKTTKLFEGLFFFDKLYFYKYTNKKFSITNSNIFYILA